MNLPQPVKVQADAAEQPCAVHLGGRPAAVAVAAVEDRWRIDEEWWRQEIARLYYLLALEDGRLVTVFRDLVSGQWYRQSYG